MRDFCLSGPGLLTPFSLPSAGPAFQGPLSGPTFLHTHCRREGGGACSAERQRTEFTLLKIINHLQVTSPKSVSSWKAVQWVICLLTGSVMLSCKAFLMNYCWHSVQKLEGSSPREEKADPLSCACCPWGLHSTRTACADGCSVAPHLYGLDSRKGFMAAVQNQGVGGQVVPKTVHLSQCTSELG